ncbi:MAG TPA: hypothetical protein VMF89_22110 [Polyangiales bacterium]|nr:hypothetical protein [Polyangiales bacterium]
MSRVHDTIRPVRSTWTVLLITLCSACSQTTEFNSDAGAAEDGGLDAQVEEDAGLIDVDLGKDDAGQALCGTRLCACSNGRDDDGDGKRDGFDNECTGPFDDDELTFRINDVREANPNCTDCFYDGNPGAGDDRCNVSSDCSLDGRPSNRGNCKGMCAATTECVDRCTPITPNGCDCFGCCEVISAGVPVPIRLVASCRMDVIGDAKACPRCIINPSCRNPCEACEICPGRTLEDLPLSCMNAVECGTRTRCQSPLDCDPTEYCGQGCCLPILL